VASLLSLDSTILSADEVIDPNAVDTKSRNALILCGLDPQTDSRSQLDMACTEIARLLSTAGTNLSHTDNEGLNAIHYGSVKGLNQFVSFLCSSGIPCDIADREGRTPIMKSVAHGFIDTFKALLDHGASVYNVDSDGLTILHYITRLSISDYRYKDFFEFILTEKRISIDINSVDGMDRTAFMYAALAGSIEIMTILLYYGADPRLEDKYGISALNMVKDPAIYSFVADANADFALKLHSKWKEATDPQVGTCGSE
jgi:ankyrin repeat protein